MRPILNRPLLLRGKIVQPDGAGLDRYVLVRNGRIESVGRRRPPLTQDAVLIEAGNNDWIFPGLLDLHTHTDYNVLPLWETNKAPFNNRFQWRGDDSYKAEVRDIYKEISKDQEKTIIAVFAELQAIAGGTTTLQESQSLERNLGITDDPLLCRGTASATDLGLRGDAKILSVVDFFRPNAAGNKATPTNQIDTYLSLRSEGKLYATLVHLAEGRSGFGSYKGVDPYSRTEFETFMAHPAFTDGGAVRSSPLSLIHGCGIDVNNPEHIKFLRDRDISVIWSPVSNLLLYEETLDVETLIAEGINVALGSDWSPSGSKHIWEEAKFARFYFEAIGSAVSDEQLFQMVTTNAAKCLGARHLGRIEPGCLADFFILRSPLESDSALEVFFKTTDRHVRAVIIGGRPVYGAREFLEPFRLDLQPLPRLEGSAVVDKVVHLPAKLEIDVDRDINRLEVTLKELDRKRSNLLSSSDTPYRGRIHKLRKDVVGYGWSVQRWRKKRAGVQRPTDLPAPPNAVRVWRGFRSRSLTPAKFLDKLGAVFIPSTVQLQPPLGMTAYLPAVVPDEKPSSVPDEIALVFYESQDVYRETFQTLGGRVYAELHGSVFGQASRSDFPILIDAASDSGKLEPDTPYHLFDQETDWQHGSCKVLVGVRKKTQQVEAFHKAVLNWIKRERDRAPLGLDGAIVCVSDDCLTYWEHWRDQTVARETNIESLGKLVTPVMLEDAQPATVSPSLTSPFAGLRIAGGEFLNFQFQRRANLR